MFEHSCGNAGTSLQEDGFDDRLFDAVRNGTARTTPAAEAIPGWQERLAAARAQRQ